MNVSVFGLGYVGCVTAACLAKEGHYIIGVDVDQHKIRSINEGRAPFYESQLSEFIGDAIAAGRLRATQDHEQAVFQSDVALICVGTPSNANGTIGLDQVRKVLAGIGAQLRKRQQYFVVALRSTVLPNVVREDLVPILEEASGNKIGSQFGFVSNPEFLREGSAVRDFYAPPWNIVGAWDERSGELVSRLYATIRAPMVRTDIETALLVKYASNIFHALKVTFANEIGSLSKEMGVDSSSLMEIFCQDRHLNISPKYLKPGFAFGGSCLPKDLRALLSEARRRQVYLPLLEAILPSNENHLKHCVRLVMETGRKKIGLVGLAFKAGTDDLRESPAVELAETLLGKGYNVRIFEPCVAPGALHGSNLHFIETTIPHIWKLLTPSLEQLIGESDVIVFTQNSAIAYKDIGHLFRPDQICINFAGMFHQGANAEPYDLSTSAEGRSQALSVTAAFSSQGAD